MVEATKAALIAKGAQAERIQHDPLAATDARRNPTHACSSNAVTLTDPSSPLTATFVPDGRE